MKYKLGDKITIKSKLSTKTGSRFNYDFTTNISTIQVIEGIELVVVIGCGVIITSEYKYHLGGGYGEDYTQGYATGKKEFCYLVRNKINSKAYYVRKSDII
jgi:hypothetical protein